MPLTLWRVSRTDRLDTFLKWFPPTSPKWAILCGSGISYASKMPTARPFMEHLLKVINASAQMKKNLEKELPDAVPLRFEGLLEVLQRTVDPKLELIDRVYFETERGTPQPNEQHRSIARIARHRPVVTTNFDVLIEKAMEQIDWSSWNNHVRFRDNVWVDNVKSGLWKIHGTVGVFARENWDIAHDGRPAATLRSIARTRNDRNREGFLKQLLKDYALLIVGYSGSDDFDISQWLIKYPCPKGIYWIAFKGKEEEGLKTFLNKRNQNVGLGPVHILDCKGKNEERVRTIGRIMRQLADKVDPAGKGVSHQSAQRIWNWRNEIVLWKRKRLGSAWDQSIVMGELLKHVHRFREAVQVLLLAKRQARSSLSRLARTNLFLAEAEVEVVEKRPKALDHSFVALRSCRRREDKAAARIVCAVALRLSPHSTQSDCDKAARNLRSICNDQAADEFSKARAAVELYRMSSRTSVQVRSLSRSQLKVRNKGVAVHSSRLG